MRLRLWHADDGARIAYREAGTGPPLVLVHSVGLSHREFEPAVEDLAHRFRLILPDLPAHGDSEDRPRHPYTFDWLASVLAAFCTDVGGRRPLVGGHGLGARPAGARDRVGVLDPGAAGADAVPAAPPAGAPACARDVVGRGARRGAAGLRPARRACRASSRSGRSAAAR